MAKPVVGITVWRRDLRTSLSDPERLHTLADAYVSAFSAAGAIPLLLPSARPPSEAGVFLDRIDGLCISGGDDVDPEAYGHENTCSVGVDPAADAWEIALLERARARFTPLLSICRGLQIMNVAFGGTLRQEVLSPGGGMHEPLKERPIGEPLQDRHPVKLTPGGRLHEIYGTDVIEVNSLHHQAPDALGDGLSLEAVAPDGVIEGAAPLDRTWWAVGVQWHPERTDGADEALFDAFVAAARAV